nr:hypothetical protein [Tanacetum cinerariifolium]
INKFIDKIKSMENNNATKVIKEYVVENMNSDVAYSDLKEDSSNATSFPDILQNKSGSKPSSKLKFRALFNEEKVENTDFVILMENVIAVKNKFSNLLVGFFIGIRVAFPLVQNYVTNTWEKFCFQKLLRMMMMSITLNSLRLRDWNM